MIAIIQYNAGNVTSVKNAITRLGHECIITDNKEEILNAKKVIFPGVGEASSAMKYLRERELDKTILSLEQPSLGICLGLQLMCSFSEEANTECLGIFDSRVRKFPSKEKVPHMGWNDFTFTKGELFNGIEKTDNVYYVHSYYADICPQTIAECNYSVSFSAAIQKNNFYATQFHPEKSAAVGERILKNFLAL
ncbi:MAG: imidazole glycerol phosphate synthase subunit HisH [Ignavibacteriae bacterium]|nr:imidazole glycerol phosphate synthase subunit HisH [Ignavibacteriota bacterium]